MLNLYAVALSKYIFVSAEIKAFVNELLKYSNFFSYKFKKCETLDRFLNLMGFLSQEIQFQVPASNYHQYL